MFHKNAKEKQANTGAIACSNVVISNRHREGLTQIYHQLSDSIYASQIFSIIITEMASNATDLSLKVIKGEINVPILREPNKGINEIRNRLVAPGRDREYCTSYFVTNISVKATILGGMCN